LLSALSRVGCAILTYVLTTSVLYTDAAIGTFTIISALPVAQITRSPITRDPHPPGYQDTCWTLILSAALTIAPPSSGDRSCCFLRALHWLNRWLGRPVGILLHQRPHHIFGAQPTLKTLADVAPYRKRPTTLLLTECPTAMGHRDALCMRQVAGARR